jgi:uncharacterized protein (TIGR00369 family)
LVRTNEHAKLFRDFDAHQAQLEKLADQLFAKYAGLIHLTDVRADLLTPFGTLHGGVMAGLVDHVLGCVLYPLMPRGQWAATTEFKLNYLAAVKGGTLTAESTVVAFGRRTAVVTVEVRNGEQLACVAQGTLLVSEPPKKAEV